jgi:ferric-dicitrate binding protein FerR (iron transport regulator)
LVQVLGTAFLVRHPADATQVRVAVANGKVHVTAARGSTGRTLTAGQVGTVTDSTIQMSAIDDPAPDVEWAPGHIMFRHTPVTSVLQTVSQWYGYHFRYADQTLGTQRVTIMVSTRSSAKALATIERLLDVNVSVVGDTVTLVPQPPRPNQSAPRIRTYDVWTPTSEVGR